MHRKAGKRNKIGNVLFGSNYCAWAKILKWGFLTRNLFGIIRIRNIIVIHITIIK